MDELLGIGQESPFIFAVSQSTGMDRLPFTLLFELLPYTELAVIPTLRNTSKTLQQTIDRNLDYLRTFLNTYHNAGVTTDLNECLRTLETLASPLICFFPGYKNTVDVLNTRTLEKSSH
jgi:hypothetical protein